MRPLARRPAGLLEGLTHLFNWFVRARTWYFTQPRFIFEAVTFGLALLVGLLVMPALIYLVGHYVLREYANGGLFALYGDFFKGLIEPGPSYWVVVAGPFAFLSLLRLFRFIYGKL